MSADTDTTDVPTVSEHAANRWAERTDAPVDPATAWRHSQRVALPNPVVHGDGARLHHETGALLVRRRSILVTVLDVDEDELQRAMDDKLETTTQ